MSNHAGSFSSSSGGKEGPFVPAKHKHVGSWASEPKTAKSLWRLVRGRRKQIIITIYQIYLCARHWAQRFILKTPQKVVLWLSPSSRKGNWGTKSNLFQFTQLGSVRVALQPQAAWSQRPRNATTPRKGRVSAFILVRAENKAQGHLSKPKRGKKQRPLREEWERGKETDEAFPVKESREKSLSFGVGMDRTRFC